MLSNIHVFFFQGISIPENWAPMPRTDTTVHMVTLLPGSPEYQMVIKKVQATHGMLSIHTIERVQNPRLYQSYMLRKQKMDHCNEGTDNERRLFHGANQRSMQAIKTNGFNRDSCGVQSKFVEGFLNDQVIASSPVSRI